MGGFFMRFFLNFTIFQNSQTTKLFIKSNQKTIYYKVLEKKDYQSNALKKIIFSAKNLIY